MDGLLVGRGKKKEQGVFDLENTDLERVSAISRGYIEIGVLGVLVDDPVCV